MASDGEYPLSIVEQAHLKKKKNRDRYTEYSNKINRIKKQINKIEKKFKN